MKALTICEPWATLIADGHKRVENRTWRTTHRGPLAIHAGKSLARYTELARAPDAFRARYGVPLPARATLRPGAVLAIATLEDVVTLTDLVDGFGWHRFAEGPWCWLLCDVRPLPVPLPWSGQQMLWNIPDNVLGELGANKLSHIARLFP